MLRPAPRGTADGSLAHPFTSFTSAINKAVAGDTIYVRGGTYNLTSTLSIGSSKSGTAANPYSMLAYPGESPVLDFRGETYSATNSGQKGVSLSGNYWHIKGLTIQNTLPTTASPIAEFEQHRSSKSFRVRTRIPALSSPVGNQPSNNLLLELRFVRQLRLWRIGRKCRWLRRKISRPGPRQCHQRRAVVRQCRRRLRLLAGRTRSHGAQLLVISQRSRRDVQQRCRFRWRW